MQIGMQFESEHAPKHAPRVGIVRLAHDDVRRWSDHWSSFVRLLNEHEHMYPNIRDWATSKVGPTMLVDKRSVYLAYVDDKPAAAAVLKHGTAAKFCHLSVKDQFQGSGLGDIFFSLMTVDAGRRGAQEAYFTLPEGLWDKRRDFFSSFGFSTARHAHAQYRLFQNELRCAAPLSEVWAAALGKLPSLMKRFSAERGAVDEGGLLMSIKPRYAEQILSGKKRVELRRMFSPRWAGHRVVLYASNPVGALVGEAKIAHVVAAPPKDIWPAFGSQLGCTRREFDEYVGESAEVFAISLDNVRPYSHRVSRKDMSRVIGVDLRPPQSYSTLIANNDWGRAVSVAAILRGELRG